MEDLKQKYYDEIKLRPGVTQEQQKAVDFFNRYNKESEANQKVADKQKSTFLNKTKNFFNEKYKVF